MSAQNSPVNVRDEVRVVNSVGTRDQNRADVNGDGIVNIQDLVLVANALGTSTTSTVLP